MAHPRCGWRRCAQQARLVVLVGEVVEAANAHGRYCVWHATVARQMLAQRQPLPVWIDWSEPPSRGRRLVGGGPGARPLHRHMGQRSGSRS